MIWIDYKKAYDSVPHSWISNTLDMMGVATNIGRFLGKAMGMWKTTLTIDNDTIGDVKIRRGIFQGDSLSPILFIMALIPLSIVLQNRQNGYKINDITVNHLLYMDDLKIYSKSDREMESLLNTVRIFSSDIHMEFGFGKCAQVTINKGKLTTSKNINLSLGKQLRQLEIDEAYKYLGIQQSSTNHSQVVKTTTMAEYNRRVRAVLKSKLSGGNQISAINTYAVPVVTYTAGIIDWTKEELRQMDTKTRKKMTMYKALHPRADIDRLYLARKKGGRGLLSVESMVNLEKTSLAEYAYNSPEPLMKILIDEGLVKFTMPKDRKKREIQGERDQRWRNKAIHGKWAEIVDKTDPKTSQSPIHPISNR